MAAYNWRLGVTRGPNLIDANPQRIGTPADARWATGRNVKLRLADRRYSGVEVWTLKRRGADGAVEVVDSGRSRAEAELFVAGAD